MAGKRFNPYDMFYNKVTQEDKDNYLRNMEDNPKAQPALDEKPRQYRNGVPVGETGYYNWDESKGDTTEGQTPEDLFLNLTGQSGDKSDPGFQNNAVIQEHHNDWQTADNNPYNSSNTNSNFANAWGKLFEDNFAPKLDKVLTGDANPDYGTYSGAIGNQTMSSIYGGMSNLASGLGMFGLDADDQAKEWKSLSQIYDLDESKKIKATEGLNYILDPRGLATDFGQQLGSMIVLTAAGVPMSPVSSLVGGALKLGLGKLGMGSVITKLAENKFEGISGDIARFIMKYDALTKLPESVMEGGGVRADAMDMKLDNADRRGLMALGENILLLTASNAAEAKILTSNLFRIANNTSLWKDGARAIPFKQYGAKIGAEMGLQGAEEFYQQAIQNQQTDKPFSWKPWAGSPDQNDAFLSTLGPTAILGAGGTAGAHYARNTMDRKKFSDHFLDNPNYKTDYHGARMSVGGNDNEGAYQTAQRWTPEALAQESANADAYNEAHPNGILSKFFNAIGMHESGDNYDATNKDSGAFGKYQIMPENWSAWAEEAGLDADAPQTAENQERVAKHKLGEYFNKYGAEGALVAWYAGESNAERWRNGESTDVWGRSWNAEQDNGPSIAQYVNDTMREGGLANDDSTPSMRSKDNEYSDIPYNKNIQVPEERNYQISDEVSDPNLATNTESKLRVLSQRYQEKFGTPLFVTSMSRNGNSDSWHDGGMAFDVADSNLEQNADARDWLVAEGRKLGLAPLDEYDHPSENATGGHIHFSNHDDDGMPKGLKLSNTSDSQTTPVDVTKGEMEPSTGQTINDSLTVDNAQDAKAWEDLITEDDRKQAYQNVLDNHADDNDLADMVDVSSKANSENSMQFIDTPENRKVIDKKYGNEFNNELKSIVEPRFSAQSTTPANTPRLNIPQQQSTANYQSINGRDSIATGVMNRSDEAPAISNMDAKTRGNTAIVTNPLNDVSDGAKGYADIAQKLKLNENNTSPMSYNAKVNTLMNKVNNALNNGKISAQDVDTITRIFNGGFDATIGSENTPRTYGVNVSSEQTKNKPEENPVNAGLKAIDSTLLLYNRDTKNKEHINAVNDLINIFIKHFPNTSSKDSLIAIRDKVNRGETITDNDRLSIVTGKNNTEPAKNDSNNKETKKPEAKSEPAKKETKKKAEESKPVESKQENKEETNSQPTVAPAGDIPFFKTGLSDNENYKATLKKVNDQIGKYAKTLTNSGKFDKERYAKDIRDLIALIDSAGLTTEEANNIKYLLARYSKYNAKNDALADEIMSSINGETSKVEEPTQEVKADDNTEQANKPQHYDDYLNRAKMLLNTFLITDEVNEDSEHQKTFYATDYDSIVKKVDSLLDSIKADMAKLEWSDEYKNMLIEDINKYANDVKAGLKLDDERSKKQKEEDEKKAKEEKEKHEADENMTKYHGFGKDLTPMQKGKIRKVLDKVFRYNGIFDKSEKLSRAEFIERIVKEPNKYTIKESTNNGKTTYSVLYEKTKQTGTIMHSVTNTTPIYTDITKVEKDYYDYLYALQEENKYKNVDDLHYYFMNKFNDLLYNKWDRVINPNKNKDVTKGIKDLIKEIEDAYSTYGAERGLTADKVKDLYDTIRSDIKDNLEITNIEFPEVDESASKEDIDHFFGNNNAEEGSNPKEYKYYLNARPAGIGTVPKGFTRIDDDDKGGRYGAIYYDHELTKDEIDEYELKPETESSANNKTAENDNTTKKHEYDNPNIPKFNENQKYEDIIKDLKSKDQNPTVVPENIKKPTKSELVGDNDASAFNVDGGKAFTDRHVIILDFDENNDKSYITSDKFNDMNQDVIDRFFGIQTYYSSNTIVEPSDIMFVDNNNKNSFIVLSNKTPYNERQVIVYYPYYAYFVNRYGDSVSFHCSDSKSNVYVYNDETNKTVGLIAPVNPNNHKDVTRLSADEDFVNYIKRKEKYEDERILSEIYYADWHGFLLGDRTKKAYAIQKKLIERVGNEGYTRKENIEEQAELAKKQVASGQKLTYKYIKQGNKYYLIYDGTEKYGVNKAEYDYFNHLMTVNDASAKEIERNSIDKLKITKVDAYTTNVNVVLDDGTKVSFKSHVVMEESKLNPETIEFQHEYIEEVAKAIVFFDSLGPNIGKAFRFYVATNHRLYNLFNNENKLKPTENEKIDNLIPKIKEGISSGEIHWDIPLNVVVRDFVNLQGIEASKAEDIAYDIEQAQKAEEDKELDNQELLKEYKNKIDDVLKSWENVNKTSKWHTYQNVILPNILHEADEHMMNRKMSRANYTELSDYEDAAEKKIHNDAFPEKANKTNKKATNEEEKKPNRSFRDSDKVTTDTLAKLGLKAKNKKSKKLVDDSDEAIAEYKAQMKKALKKNSNSVSMNGLIKPFFDPEVMIPAFKLGTAYIQRGIKKFSDFSNQLLDDFGDIIKPWIKSIWNTSVSYTSNDFDEEKMSTIFEYVGAQYEDGVVKLDDIKSGFEELVGKDEAKPFMPMIESAYKGVEAFFNSNVKPISIKGENENADNTSNNNTERDSERNNQNPVGRDDEGQESSGRGRKGISETDEGNESQGGKRIHYGSTASSRETGNSAVQNKSSRDGNVNTRGSELYGSSLSNYERDGVLDEEGTIQYIESPKDGRDDEKTVKKSSYKVADETSIASEMPYLKPEQVTDVAKAEKRFHENNGQGFLLANGMGTGKTFSGLGVIKRLIDHHGAKEIIILAPTAKVVKDWIESGKNYFGIDIHALDGTDDGGGGVCITTYANFGQNKEIAKHKWDAVIADESHNIMGDENGTVNSYCKKLRAITNHHNGFETHFHILHEKEYNDITSIDDKIKKTKDADERDRLGDERKAKFDALMEKKEAAKEKWDSVNAEDKPKVLFLSGTPIQYDKDVDYLEGYLFNYKEDTNVGSYNNQTGYDQFMIEHFGYRMRYHRLTTPSKEVDSRIMEIEFHNWLVENGYMSARKSYFSMDYDRGFLKTESHLAEIIDEAFKLIRTDQRYSILQNYISGQSKRTFKYIIECLKAKESIPYIKEYLKAGKKVVVFHQAMKSELIANPFVFHIKSNDPSGEVAQERYEEFKAKFPELFDGTLTKLMNVPETMEREFGDLCVTYNGNDSDKAKIESVKNFNYDNGMVKIIVCQQDAANAGISLHDKSGNSQRVLINLGIPARPSYAMQIEARIYRLGVRSNAIIRYLTTGTTLENYLWTDTIASKAETVENIALGNEARGLYDAFGDAYMETFSDDWKRRLPNHELEGTGGKEIDAQMRGDSSDYDRAKTFYYSNQKKTSTTKSAEGNDYYATPEPVGYKMVQWLDLVPTEKALEPSAGHGAISRWFNGSTENTIIEPSDTLRTMATLRTAGAKSLGITFENYSTIYKADGIAMNPPFGTGGKTAVEHIEKAFNHLHNGGRLIAILPTGASADAHFDKWFYGINKKGEQVDDGCKEGVLRGEIKLPPCTFNRAGTSVGTRIVIVDRLERQKDRDLVTGYPKQIDLSYCKDVNELFDALENIEMPERVIKADPNAEEKAEMFKADGENVTPVKKLGKDNFKSVARIAEMNDGEYNKATRRFEFKDEQSATKFVDEASEFLINDKKPDGFDDFVENKNSEPVIDDNFFETSPYTNTKTKEKMTLVTMARYTNSYNEIKKIAKQHNGYFSKFAKGFLFKNQNDAQGFVNDSTSKIGDNVTFSNETVASVGDYENVSFSIAHQKGSETTQVKDTEKTYRRVVNWIVDKVDQNLKTVLDYGAGLGVGRKIMLKEQPQLDIEAYEIEPRIEWEGGLNTRGENAPEYTNSDDIVDEYGNLKRYGLVANLNVLNVLNEHIRAEVVADIGNHLEVGGHAVIGTRGDDVYGAKYVDCDANGGVIIHKKVERELEVKDKKGNTKKKKITEIVPVYQKGFKPKELLEYVQGILGDGFKVEITKGKDAEGNDAKFCQASVIVTRISDKDVAIPDVQNTEYVFDYKIQPKNEKDVYYTRNGSPIQRYNGVVGKEMPKIWYVHKDYVDEVDAIEKDKLKTAEKMLAENFPDFEYKVIVRDRSTSEKKIDGKKVKVVHNTIRFVEAPDFDTAREPVVGVQVIVDFDTMSIEKKKFANQVWHHKWNWVKDDYKGFNVEASKAWSRLWLSALGGPADGSKIENWQTQLKRNPALAEFAMDTEGKIDYDKVAKQRGFGEVGKKPVNRRFSITEDDSVDDNNITIDDVEKAFSGFDVQQVDDDTYSIQMPNGKNLIVNVVDKIVMSEAQAEKARKAHGLAEGTPIYANGYYVRGENGRIVIARKGEKGTLYHEILHLAKEFMTDEQNKALEKAYGNEEKQADACRRFRLHPANNAKNPVARAFKFVWKLYDSIASLFGSDKAKARNVFRDIENGKVLKQGRKQATGEEVMFSGDSEMNAVRKKYEGTDKWMKAPNGKKTNLTEKQWLQVRTPSFKRWFGDWENDPKNASKVVDKNGEPKVVYHGSEADFNTFNMSIINNGRAHGDGAYFTDNFDNANRYTHGKGKVKSVFLNIRNPRLAVEERFSGTKWGEDKGKHDGGIIAWKIKHSKYYKFEDLMIKSYPNEPAIESIQTVGGPDEAVRDGETSKDFFERMRANNNVYQTHYVVPNPNQIKSATDNVGTFDPNNPDIRYSISPTDESTGSKKKSKKEKRKEDLQAQLAKIDEEIQTLKDMGVDIDADPKVSGEKTSENIKEASDAFITKSNDYTVNDKGVKTYHNTDKNAIGLYNKWAGSPTNIGRKNRKINNYVKCALKADETYNRLNIYFGENLKKAFDWCGGKKGREQLINIFWDEDENQKEYTRLEMRKKFNASAGVIRAHDLIRRLLNQALKLVNEARRGEFLQPEKLVSEKQLQMMQENKFIHILGTPKKNENGQYLVKYKETKHWMNHMPDATAGTIYEMTHGERKDDFDIIKIENNEDGTYSIDYYECPAEIKGIKGYITHFFNSYVVYVEREDMDSDGKPKLVNVKTIDSFTTENEAQKFADEYSKENTLGNGEYVVVKPVDTLGHDLGNPSPAVVGEKELYRIVGGVANTLGMSYQEAKESLGDSVRMTSRHRFLGQSKRRIRTEEGQWIEGYENKDLEYVLQRNFCSISRYYALEMYFKPQFVHMFERQFGKSIEAGGLDGDAKYLQDYFHAINGNPPAVDQELYKAINKTPIGDVVRRYFGDDYLNNFVGMQANIEVVTCLGLLNVGSATLNVFQLMNALTFINKQGRDTTEVASTLAKNFAKAIRGFNKLTPEQKGIVRKCGVLYQEGLDNGLAHDVNSKKLEQLRRTIRDVENPVLKLTFAMADRLFGKGSLVFFNKAERAVRVATVLSEFELATKHGASRKQAFEQARDINAHSNFIYSKADNPMILNKAGMAGTFFMQFKKYAFKQMEIMNDMLPQVMGGSNLYSTKQRITFWITYLLLVCGLCGLPAEEFLDSLLKFCGAGSLKDKGQRYVMETLHDYPWLAKTIMHGAIASTFGINITSRAGMGDVIPTDVFSLGGPFVSKAHQFITANDGWNRARAISPSIYNYGMAITAGESVNSRGRVINRYDTPTKRAIRAIGFKSEEEQLAADRQRIVYGSTSEMSAEKNRAVDEYVANPTLENRQKAKRLGVDDKTLNEARKLKNMDRSERLNYTQRKHSDFKTLLNFDKD